MTAPDRNDSPPLSAHWEIHCQDLPFSRGTTFRLRAEGFEIAENRPKGEEHEPLWQPTLLAWRDITKIRIRRSPTKSFGNRYVCDVIARNERAQFTNERGASFMGNDQSERFAEFVRELCRKTAAANPEARFVVGHAPLHAAVVVTSALVLGAVIVVFAPNDGDPAVPVALPVAAVVIATAAIAYVLIQRSRPEKPFDPCAIPDAILPRSRSAAHELFHL